MRLKKIALAGNPAADQFDDETAPLLTAKAAHPAIDNRQADRQAEELRRAGRSVGRSVSDIDLRRPIVHVRPHTLGDYCAPFVSQSATLRSRLPLFSVQTAVDWITGLGGRGDELWGREKFRAAVALH